LVKKNRRNKAPDAETNTKRKPQTSRKSRSRTTKRRSRPVPRTLYLALLVLLTLAVFGRAIGFEFTSFDDPAYVTANSEVRSGLSWNGLVWAFSTAHTGNWHPLTWLSLMLDSWLGGINAGVFHAVNVLLHIANTVLVFLFLDRITGATSRAAFVAALFAIHPLHVESVAWVAERKDVLSGCLWLLTMLAWARYRRQDETRSYLVALLTFTLGLMAKPMLVSLPIVLLLLDVWPFADRRAELSRRVREIAPFFALALVSSCVTFLVQKSAGSVLSLQRVPLASRLANAVTSATEYLAKTIWPDRLAVFYPFASIPTWRIVASGIALLAATLLVLRFRNSRPWLVAGWGWYLVTLVPVIGIVQVGLQSMADRYTYIPLIGIFIIVAWEGSALLRWLGSGLGLHDTGAHRLAVTVGCACIAALALGSVRQVGVWRDSVSLFGNAVEIAPSALSHTNLGMVLQSAGRVDEALLHYQQALRLDAAYADARSNLAGLYLRHGKLDDAIAEYSAVVRADPRFTPDRVGLVSALIKKGRYQEAIDQCREGLRLDEDNPLLHGILGQALMMNGDAAAAIPEFEESLRLSPGAPAVQTNLGLLLCRNGRFEEGLGHLREVLRKDPGYVAARVYLGVVLAEAGRLDEAAAEFSEVLRRDPEHRQARDGLAWVRSRLAEKETTEDRPAADGKQRP
jgi:protein O-mannosyl-transferase